MVEKLLRESERGTFLRVLVRPNSRNRDLIYHLSETELVVNLKRSAREGKANTELVKRIAKVLGISTGDIKLVSGHRSREKTLLISSMSAAQVLQVLSTLQKH